MHRRLGSHINALVLVILGTVHVQVPRSSDLAPLVKHYTLLAGRAPIGEDARGHQEGTSALPPATAQLFTVADLGR